MIEERELLQRCLDEFDYKGVACNELCIDIHKLLAQPEYEADRRSDPISKLRNLRDIQGRKGNYDIDEYMRGLYNGLELSLSIFEDRGPDYKEHIAQPEIRELLTQKREPLGDEAVCEILLKKEWKGFVDLVRIIEKAHGIGGE